jgi:hypothetical protein
MELNHASSPVSKKASLLSQKYIISQNAWENIVKLTMKDIIVGLMHTIEAPCIDLYRSHDYKQ